MLPISRLLKQFKGDSSVAVLEFRRNWGLFVNVYRHHTGTQTKGTAFVTQAISVTVASGPSIACMAEDLDDIDRAIIRDLQDDGRRSFRDIARSLNVVEGTVRARVKRLQSSGVLSIVAFVDPVRMGTYRLSLLLVKVDPKNHARVVEALAARPEVSYLSTALGAADLLIEFVAENEQGRWEFVNAVVRPLPGVISAEITSIVQTHKLHYRMPAFPDSAPNSVLTNPE